MAHKNITPDTKVGELLSDFPDLEEVLIGLSPAFKKLSNPILRKTVGKVATLRQVAQVGKIPLGDLINTLREAAGLSAEEFAETGAGEGGAAPPAWFDKSRIVKSFDARPMIEAGHQPMGQVTTDWKKLQAGEIYELITPFPPAPLLDMAEGKGIKSWSRTEAADLVRTWFCRVD